MKRRPIPAPDVARVVRTIQGNIRRIAQQRATEAGLSLREYAERDLYPQLASDRQALALVRGALEGRVLRWTRPS
jgi:hypothetical protein